MEWTVTAPVILHQKNYRFNPVTNKHHEIIIKYCMSKDDKGLVIYLQSMLQQLVTDDVQISDLPVLDQLFLLVRLRSLCIGTRLDVIIDKENKAKHRVSLIDIQKSINEHYIHPVTISDSTNTVDVTIHYTKNWFSNELIDHIHEIVIDGKDTSFNMLSSEQKQQIIDHLDTSHIKKIQTQVNMLKQSINRMVFVKMPGEEADVTITADQFTHILRIIYSDTLNNFVELMYVFVKILNFTLSDVMSLTPSDTQLYYQMFVKETNERDKAQKQAQNQSSARNLPTK